jgi:hypothetical protein
MICYIEVPSKAGLIYIIITSPCVDGATSEYESSQTKSFNVDGGHSLIPGKEAWTDCPVNCFVSRCF